MLFEEELQKRLLTPDLLVTSGSCLYGTNTPISDVDSRGFILPPFLSVIGVRNFEQYSSNAEDRIIFSLKRFMDLAKGSDPSITECLFVPEDKILAISSIGEKIRKNRNLFLSKRIYFRVLGYSNSEWRKAKGVRLEVSKRTVTADNVINDLRNLFKPDKLDMDQIIEILDKNLERKEIKSTNDLGEKRKKEFWIYGFGVSAAAHSIRLCQEIKELLLTSFITFPRPNADVLLGIRQGKYNYSEVEEMYNTAVSETESTFEKSSLPKKPDEKAIGELYTEIVKEHFNIP